MEASAKVVRGVSSCSGAGEVYLPARPAGAPAAVGRVPALARAALAPVNAHAGGSALPVRLARAPRARPGPGTRPLAAARTGPGLGLTVRLAPQCGNGL